MYIIHVPFMYPYGRMTFSLSLKATYAEYDTPTTSDGIKGIISFIT